MRPAVMSLVRSLGHDVVGFESAEEFLASAAVDSAACIITDIQMPGMSGIDLKRHLAAVGNPAPVIMITARAEPGIESQALASGAAGFLRKPFHAEALIGCLNIALASS
jgi:FixJ family two-component response regulator